MQPHHGTDTSNPQSSLNTLSQEAFYRNLPELVKTHCRHWVAYHGDELIGYARTQAELYERCLRQGLKEDQFIVLFADHAALADHEAIDLPANP